MKVLFVPHPMPSHLTPLVALAERVARCSDVRSAFLLPRSLHEFARGLGAVVLDVDRRLQDGIIPEVTAFSRFQPDVVVDDLSPTTAFFVRIVSIPRISIIRKGLFPGDNRSGEFRHSSDVGAHFDAIKAMNLPARGLWAPDELSDLFTGYVNLIPSVAEIEVLPPTLRNSEAYRHIGPLLLDDEKMMGGLRCFDRDVAIADPTLTRFAALAPIRDPRSVAADFEQFLHSNRARPLIYFNIGLAYPQPLYDIHPELIQAMLATGAAIVSNVKGGDLTADSRERYFEAPYLPMHRVCSEADLMVHQCGSATYSYQILHECPAIILGSGCFDRDCVAARLNEIGAATYLPLNDIRHGDLGCFRRALQDLLFGPDELPRRAQIGTLRKLHQDLLEAQSLLDFGALLRETVTSFNEREKGAGSDLSG